MYSHFAELEGCLYLPIMPGNRAFTQNTDIVRFLAMNDLRSEWRFNFAKGLHPFHRFSTLRSQLKNGKQTYILYFPHLNPEATPDILDVWHAEVCGREDTGVPNI